MEASAVLLNIPQLPLLRLLRASSQDRIVIDTLPSLDVQILHVFVASVVVVVCVPGSLLEPPFAQVDDAMSPPADLFAPTSYAILKLYIHYEVLEKNSLWIPGEGAIDYSNASLTS